jgi:leucyl aminopeptidase
MIDLPDFHALRVTRNEKAPTRDALDPFDHVVLAVPKKTAAPRELLELLPGTQADALLARAVRAERELVGVRLTNRRATGITLAIFDPAGTPFAALTWARQVIAAALAEQPRRIAISALGLPEPAAQSALSALLAAGEAAAFRLPSYKSTPAPPPLAAIAVLGGPKIDVADARAKAFGNNVARWFTALPPNELTVESYRAAIEQLVEPLPITTRFLSERQLERLGAGAFLAVARGNATRDAGILHLRYRPSRAASPQLALVGKGILFDTGGSNLKPFKGMLDMHTDMQGSAVALGTLLALARLEVPYAVDCWLALTENRLSPTAYKPQDLVRASNGTTIQVIHTDAEGRMVLADTLALAAREQPAMMIDFATLTGACVVALTERYSGVFSNRASAHALLLAAGAASGERVWPLPMDDDFDELLKSEIADVKQCAVESEGDHILAARFLSRFVPKDIPWVHVDLSAGSHKGGLAHVPTEITGFGVRFTLELLRTHVTPAALAAKLTA